MAVKLIALDLDGTLTDDNKHISEYTKEIIREAVDKGAQIALASGRPMFGINHVATELELDKIGGYILAYNGGHIMDYRSKEDIFKVTFPIEYVQEAVDFAHENKLAIVSYDDNDIVTEGPVDEYVEHDAFNNSSKVRVLESLPAYLTFPFVKMVICGEPEKLANAEKVLAKQFEGRLDIFRAEPVFLEMMPRGVNKAAGLTRLMNYLNITSDEVMACGDANNDVPMLKLAKYSVAVSNACESAKSVSAYITDSNNNDGVAKAIKKFVLDT